MMEAGTINLTLFGAVDESSCRRLLRKIGQAEGRGIQLRIDSPGGELDAAIGIWQALLEHRGEVETVVVGRAYSAASLIASAGRRRSIYRNGSIGLHNAYFNAADPPSEIPKILSQVNRTVAEAMAFGLAIPWRTVAEWMENERFFSAAEAIEMGLAHHVVNTTTRSPFTRASWADDAPLLEKVS